MPEIGYAMSSEEHRPNDLVDHAVMAEEAGFTFGLVSDHYHPWIDRQGQSPFIWTVLGAMARATRRIRIGTGVTCPTIRYHPAVVAQMAATVEAMMPGRFFLGLGSGENLNEHITGQRWPETAVRQDMLAEAITIIRALWKGGYQSHHGAHYTVENARLYTLPDRPPPIYLAAGGPEAAELAGRSSDGLITTAPEAELVKAFKGAGGTRKPRHGQFTVCWATDVASARRTARDIWPTSAIRGAASQELPLPSHFEALAEGITEDQVAESVLCGPDPGPHIEKIEAFAKAGFDHVYVHQVGPDQAGFVEFYRRRILPHFRSKGRSRRVNGRGPSNTRSAAARRKN